MAAYLPILVIDRSPVLYGRLDILTNRNKIIMSMFFIYGFLLCILRPGSISISRLVYLLIFAFLWTPYIYKNEKRHKGLFTICWFTSLGMILAITLASNQGVAVSGLASIFTFIPFLAILAEKQDRYTTVFLSSILVLFIFTYGWLIHELEGGYRTPLDKRTLCTEGPAKGIYISDNFSKSCEDRYDIVSEYVQDDDVLLIISDNYMSIDYMVKESRYATFCPYDVSPFTNRLVKFYGSQPERKPTIVLLDTQVLKGDVDNFWELYPLDRFLHDYYVIVSTEGNYIVLRQKDT